MSCASIGWREFGGPGIPFYSNTIDMWSYTWITAVIHPSYWQPPYIHILPEQFLENIVESLFYFADVTPCNMK